jgi:hypothetical protein
MTTATYEPLNSSKLDYYTSDGVRVSMPLYFDLPNQRRKDLLNGFRNALQAQTMTESSPSSMSGIRVESHGLYNNAIEKYIGMDLACLRGVLFQRGGLPADLILRLQAVTGVEVITEQDIRKAFDQRKKTTVSYTKDNMAPPSNG